MFQTVNYIFIYFPLIHREQSKYGRRVFCEPCSFENKSKEADRFCKSCQDPEPMCEDCAKEHTRHRITRGHKMCLDLEQFLNIQDMSEKE